MRRIPVLLPDPGKLEQVFFLTADVFQPRWIGGVAPHSLTIDGRLRMFNIAESLVLGFAGFVIGRPMPQAV
jgi:hypothetical protein